MINRSIAYHIKGIRLALAVMHQLGFDAPECLKGTRIELTDLEQENSTITHQQQDLFYRNLLNLSNDPLLGLKLGEAYRMEHSGMLGYAMLSASTLKKSVDLAVQFYSLLYSRFKPSMWESHGIAGLRFHRDHPVPDDLLQLFCDRDLSSSWKSIMGALDVRISPLRVSIMHHGTGQHERYQRYFGCPVDFAQPYAEIQLDARLLNTPMPRHDLQTSLYCQQQCQRMIDRLSKQSPFVDQVRGMLVEHPGKFPNIEKVSFQLNMSVRTLRRRLKAQDRTFQQLLDEIRFQLARDYLANGLPVAQVADLLGYSENANFTHAFKRWSGLTPTQFRENNHP